MRAEVQDSKKHTRVEEFNETSFYVMYARTAVSWTEVSQEWTTSNTTTKASR